ncbi:hypothetical protein APICC_08727 [Apis cerana cerana]|uniref:Uncharacterized protein n=1 Tax=Apis cerana cerana TaxID=94128 RepID=A0A2A3E2U6_APICC|nr:hypothetical protein APICC_08727 [Apis cerana cerana]
MNVLYIIISIMEEVNRNVEKRLSDRETEMKIETKDESASRKEATNRSVNLGQVLPLMQFMIMLVAYDVRNNFLDNWRLRKIFSNVL